VEQQMTNEDDHLALNLMIRGFQASQLFRLAADLEVADRVAPDGSVAVADMAAACNVLPMPLLRILRALAALGVFRVSAEGVVTHSPRSLLLRRDAPNSLHYAARFWPAPGSWKAWGALDAALAGGSPHRTAWEMGRFDYLRGHPDEARVFDQFMAHTPDNRHAAMAAAYDFSAAGLIVDVGGGNGQALREVLTRFPEAKGLLLDLADVVEAVSPEARLNGRIATAGQSFFERVPEGGDFYLLNWVLHDWADDDCLRILAACRAAMRDGAKLLIGERLLDPDPSIGDPIGYLVDTHMMAMFGEARERSEAEFRALLEPSGFAISRVVATASPFAIVEAVPK
jgi:hypothetical protein